MIRAIFFDIDGTLVSLKSKVYSASTADALEQLHRKGILVYVATGRSRFEISEEHMLDGLYFDGYLTNNGQVALDADGNTIYSKPIDPKEAEAVLQIAQKLGLAIWIAAENGNIVSHYNERVRMAMQSIHTALPPIGDVWEALRRPIHKIVLFADAEEMRQVMRYAPHCRSTQWYEFGRDVMSVEGGKHNAMREILQARGIDLSETMAFGDSENDIEMLRCAQIGVAMGNATPEAKAAADYVTDDEDADGIRNALLHFGLIE